MTAALLRNLMPYGAPELQEAARPHMVRALALSSLIASLAFAVAWSVSLVTPHANPIQLVIPDAHQLEDGFQVLKPPPPIQPVEIARPKPAGDVVDAMPVPAKDTSENLEITIPSQGDKQAEPSAAKREGEGTAPPSDGPVNVIGEVPFVDQLPAPVTVVHPDYPDIARQAQVEGLVIVNVLVGKDGRVSDARIHPKVNVPLLDQAALEAARKWVFTPALMSNHPVSVWVTIPFRFTLRN